MTFGSILGEDRKPLKTRSGENVKLAELLDEAVSRAESLIRTSEADPAKRRGFSEDEIHDIAEAVGIGAVKYADLSQNRQTDYVFSWDQMLAMEGNTAPYLMYAYARIRSIYRKGAEDSRGSRPPAAITLTEPAERALARQILRLARDPRRRGRRPADQPADRIPVRAGRSLHEFYEACPVLKADTDAAAGLAPQALRPDRPRPAHRPGPARHPRGRTDVEVGPTPSKATRADTAAGCPIPQGWGTESIACRRLVCEQLKAPARGSLTRR